MENASKALIMAGSVLLALLIIGTLVFMFNSLSNLKREEASSEEVIKIVEFNKKIQMFDRDLYGSELISLANLIDDYNKSEAAEYVGYKEITLKVNMEAINIEMNGYMDKIYNSYEKLVKDYKENIEKKLEDFKKTEKVLNINIGKSAKDWSGMTDLQQSIHLENLQKSKNLNNIQIEEIRKEMSIRAEEYSNLKTASNTFKNRKFRPNVFEYDVNTDRVTRIEFEVMPI